MFARRQPSKPTKPKPTSRPPGLVAPTGKPLQAKPVTTKPAPASKPPNQVVFSNSRLRPPMTHTITKIASIRTLPPFMLPGSELGSNSQHKSIEGSEVASQAWREDYEPDTLEGRHSIHRIDEELKEVLDTIRKERSIIDMKIWKLREKFLETQRKRAEARSRGIQGNHAATMTQQINEEYKPPQQEVSVQCPSLYFMQLAYTLGLQQQCSALSVQEQVDQVTKIEDNKRILLELLGRTAYM